MGVGVGVGPNSPIGAPQPFFKALQARELLPRCRNEGFRFRIKVAILVCPFDHINDFECRSPFLEFLISNIGIPSRSPRHYGDNDEVRMSTRR